MPFSQTTNATHNLYKAALRLKQIIANEMPRFERVDTVKPATLPQVRSQVPFFTSLHCWGAIVWDDYCPKFDFWNCCFAKIICPMRFPMASALKRASAGWVRGSGDIALEHNALLFNACIGNWNSLKQGLRIRTIGGENTFLWSQTLTHAPVTST